MLSVGVLTQPFFHDEAAAVTKLESIVWPTDVVCPHCGVVGEGYELKGKRSRIGLRRCKACKKDFTVRVGTIFESSHVELYKWFQAVYLMASSKKGISAHQLHRTLEVTYKTAWFMAHRIRKAMRSGDLAAFGGAGGIVEVDETFIGNDRAVKPKGEKKGRGYAHKYEVLSLVDRTTGRARSMVVDGLKAADMTPTLTANIAAEAHVMADEAGQYKRIGEKFAAHDFVSHGKGEYGRGLIHTNTIEGFFSVFKRGMKGVYQHSAKKQLHRYLAEFDFRYYERAALGVNDERRTEKLFAGIVGRRLMYRDSFKAAV